MFVILFHEHYGSLIEYEGAATSGLICPTTRSMNKKFIIIKSHCISLIWLKLVSFSRTFIISKALKFIFISQNYALIMHNAALCFMRIYDILFFAFPYTINERPKSARANVQTYSSNFAEYSLFERSQNIHRIFLSDLWASSKIIYLKNIKSMGEIAFSANAHFGKW